MQLTQVFQALGEDGFRQVLGVLSIGKLKTYRLYEQLKARSHLPKLNVQGLRKVTPRFWVRLLDGDEDLAADLAQSVLVCNLDMIVEILDFLGVPHQDGFFAKDLDASDVLTEGWQQRTYEKFRGTYPAPLLLFYINHLAREVTKTAELFAPAE